MTFRLLMAYCIAGATLFAADGGPPSERITGTKMDGDVMYVLFQRDPLDAGQIDPNEGPKSEVSLGENDHRFYIESVATHTFAGGKTFWPNEFDLRIFLGGGNATAYIIFGANGEFTPHTIAWDGGRSQLNWFKPQLLGEQFRRMVAVHGCRLVYSEAVPLLEYLQGQQAALEQRLDSSGQQAIVKSQDQLKSDLLSAINGLQTRLLSDEAKKDILDKLNLIIDAKFKDVKASLMTEIEKKLNAGASTTGPTKP